jgi:Fur family transcriptional regulator, ferric uptake regulator
VIRIAARCATRAMPAPTSMAALLNTVRAHGLRVSTARRLVLGALDAAERPLTAEEIAAQTHDLGSVYRNLEALEAIGVVHHVHLGHAAGRYELRGRTAGWASCEGCGRSTPLTAGQIDAIRAAVRRVTGFDARFSHFPIAGRCPDCHHERIIG